MVKKPVRLFVAGVSAIAMVGLLLLVLSSAQAAASAPTGRIWADDFNASSLDSSWSWIREDNTHWSLVAHPGFLRITTQQGALWANSNDGKNLLLRDAPVGDFEVQTRLIFTPTENIQSAGLLAYQDDDNYLLLIRAYCGWCVGNGIYFDHEEQGTSIGSNYAMTTTVLGEAYLRLVRHGTVYTGFVSENGTDWTLMGAHAVVSGMVPSKIGLAAYNSPDFAASEIAADFDFFQLDDGSYYVFLPLVVRNN